MCPPPNSPPLRVCDPDLECRRDPGQSRQGEAGAMLYIPLPSRVFFSLSFISPSALAAPLLFPGRLRALVGYSYFFLLSFRVARGLPSHTIRTQRKRDSKYSVQTRGYCKVAVSFCGCHVGCSGIANAVTYATEKDQGGAMTGRMRAFLPQDVIS